MADTNEIIYRQGRRKNKKNPDGYEYLINERIFKTPEGAKRYGQKLLDTYKGKSEKQRVYDEKSGTYKTFDTREDYTKHLQANPRIHVGEEVFETRKDYDDYIKKIDARNKKISEYDPFALQEKIEKLEAEIEGLSPRQKTLKMRYLKKIGQLQEKLKQYDETETPKPKLNW